MRTVHAGMPWISGLNGDCFRRPGPKAAWRLQACRLRAAFSWRLQHERSLWWTGISECPGLVLQERNQARRGPVGLGLAGLLQLGLYKVDCGKGCLQPLRQVQHGAGNDWIILGPDRGTRAVCTERRALPGCMIGMVLFLAVKAEDEARCQPLDIDFSRHRTAQTGVGPYMCFHLEQGNILQLCVESPAQIAHGSQHQLRYPEQMAVGSRLAGRGVWSIHGCGTGSGPMRDWCSVMRRPHPSIMEEFLQLPPLCAFHVTVMKRIVCQFPARLHFGLLDMNGSLGRVDGGIGLAIEQPATVLEAIHASRIQVPASLDPPLQERLQWGLEAVCRHLQLPGVEIRVLQRPMPHSGFGSATQLLVGAAKAVSLLAQHPLPAPELARLMGRGGTSGIGTAAIDGGGFILDGGHAFQRGPLSKQGFVPSGAAQASVPPPVLMQVPFPREWQILICRVQGLDISGKREVDLFARECPVPDSDVACMSRILLAQILPALAERDLAQFCTGLEDYQRHGFKTAEIRTQADTVRACMAFLRQAGGQGVGMSSWGPVVYAIGQDLQPLQQEMEQWMQQHGGGEAFTTRADNTGHRILL